jgi:hypothetical protein
MLRRLGLLLLLVTAGCARPYAGPKTLAAIGTTLLVGGGAAWAMGERTDRRALVAPGFVSTVVGAVAIIGAGGWLALSIACRVDPDCPDGEACKEVPAPPGGIPYRQCVRR